MRCRAAPGRATVRATACAGGELGSDRDWWHGWFLRARSSRCLGEGRLDHLLLSELAAIQLCDDAAVAEHIDVVAIVQLFRFGGVPQEGTTGSGFRPDQFIDFELGADIDAAHRIIHQHDPRIRSQSASKEYLLLVTPRERKNVVP